MKIYKKFRNLSKALFCCYFQFFRLIAFHFSEGYYSYLKYNNEKINVKSPKLFVGFRIMSSLFLIAKMANISWCCPAIAGDFFDLISHAEMLGLPFSFHIILRGK